MSEDTQTKKIVTVPPTLFLFLGSSSGLVGWRLKNLFKQIYGEIPLIKFLWLDIQKTMPTEAEATFDRRTERGELNGFDPTEIVRNLDNHPAIRSWWPKASPPPGRLSGSGGSPRQMRLVGRLAFFAKLFQRGDGISIYDRLEDALNGLKQIRQYDRTDNIKNINYKFVSDDSGVTVYVVFSPCGGTGSSMAFDIAHLCKHILGSNQAKVIGVSMAPNVFDNEIEDPAQKRKAKTNAYAWFKEHNSLLEAPSWKVEYSKEIVVDSLKSPFDASYIIDIENQSGKRLGSLADVASMIAQSLFLRVGTDLRSTIGEFEGNAHSVGTRFEGKIRAYSSFAVSSLRFPKDRLRKYCGAMYAVKLLQDGLLGNPEPDATARWAATIINRCGLKDDVLIKELLADTKMNYLLEPSIKSARDVSTSVSLLTQQEADCKKLLEDITKRLDAKDGRYEVLLRDKQALLEAEIVQLLKSEGIRSAYELVNTLLEIHSPVDTEEPNTKAISQLKNLLVKKGKTDADVKKEKDEYIAAINELRGLDKEALSRLESFFSKKNWEKKIKADRDNALTQLKDVFDVEVSKHATQLAIRLLDALTASLETIRTTLRKVIESENRRKDALTKISTESKKTGIDDPNKFELSREVEVDFDSYYKKLSVGAKSIKDFSFIPAEINTISAFADWFASSFLEDVTSYGSMNFDQALADVSIMDAMKEVAVNEKVNPEKYIAEKIDAMVRYSRPFFPYDPDRGMEEPDTKTVIGLESANTEILKDMDVQVTNLFSTGLKDRIDVGVYQYGLPIHMLRRIEECKHLYDENFRTSGGKAPDDPLHILPGITQFSEDFMPETDQEQKQLFALGIAFKYIVKKGQSYYVDLEKNAAQGRSIIQANKLDTGREKAAAAFSQRGELVQNVKELIEKDILRMGNDAAIEFLNNHISSLREQIDSYKSQQKYTLTSVFEEEIKQIQQYIETLKV